jgi:hypothetical protein
MVRNELYEAVVNAYNNCSERAACDRKASENSSMNIKKKVMEKETFVMISCK